MRRACARRVGVELFAARTFLGGHLWLPATGGLVADMEAALGRDARDELRIQVYQVTLA